MANSFPDNIIQTKLNWIASNGEPWTNVFHFEWTGSTPILFSDLVGFNGELEPRLLELLALMSNHATLVDFTSQDVSLVDGPPRTVFPGAQATTSVSLSGSKTGDGLPTQVALEMMWHAQASGRRFKGRQWFGGVSESDQTGVQGPDAATVADWNGWASDFITGPYTDGNFVIVSYKYTEFSSVVTGSVHPGWRTQRRRAY